MLSKLEQCRVPTIAAITGACTGGGAGIAACCDMRIGTKTTQNRLPDRAHARQLPVDGEFQPARRAGRPGAGQGHHLHRAAGRRRGGRRAGLLNEVVEDVAALQRRADELAAQIAGHAPLTLDATKQALRRLQRPISRDEGEDLILMCYMSRDFREGLDAFLNKRTPNWTGK